MGHLAPVRKCLGRYRHSPWLGDTQDMGFNPFRQQKRRPSDYVLVAAAFIVVALLVLWAAIPR